MQVEALRSNHVVIKFLLVEHNFSDIKSIVAGNWYHRTADPTVSCEPHKSVTRATRRYHLALNFLLVEHYFYDMYPGIGNAPLDGLMDTREPHIPI